MIETDNYKILQLSALTDNYIYIIHCKHTETTAAIDPSVSDVVLKALEEENWQLDYILNTHHHWDHTGGNKDLKRQTKCTIIGYAKDEGRIPGIDIEVDDNDEVSIGKLKAKVVVIPAHTLGHIAYYFAKEKLLFCGDTLFSMGCGRVFEGTYDMMYKSLNKIKQLPGDVIAFPAHEYSLRNAEFALTLEPNNLDLQKRYKEVKELRQRKQATIPIDLETEFKTNPFLRVDSKEIRENIGLENVPDVDVFAKIRRMKDSF